MQSHNTYMKTVILYSFFRLSLGFWTHSNRKYDRYQLYMLSQLLQLSGSMYLYDSHIFTL